MSRIEWISLILGTVQSLATVAALYFAWRAVEEAHATRREAKLEQQALRFEQLTVLIGEVRRAYEYGAQGTLEQRERLDRLKALLRSVPHTQLMKTRALADAVPGQPYPDHSYLALNVEAAEEIAHALGETFGPRLGQEAAEDGYADERT